MDALSTITSPDESDLSLSRRGTRFLDDRMESGYRTWQADRSVPFNRSALAAGAGLGAVQALVFWRIRPEGIWPWLAPLLAAEVMAMSGYVASKRADSGRWIQPFITTLNVLSGIGTLALLSIHLGFTELSFGACVAFFFLAMVGSRTRPLPAASATATMGVCHVVLATHSFHRGGTTLGSFALQLIMTPALFGAAVQAALVTEAGLRQAFRQERIIERQQESLRVERARSEALLRHEVSYQVAARSRELGAALAQSDVTFDVRELSAGERFAERYRIIAALGTGGMGAVYEVERLTDGAKLALKAVLGDVSGVSAVRFAREAEIGAQIHHPNLVGIVDVGISAGVPFLVMELVRGGSLEGQRARFGDVPWALPILAQVAEGLAALHDAGVVHRDLKPANVLLSDDAGSGSVAKISDFGISRLGALDDSISIDPSAVTAVAQRALTGTGVVIGTPLYMAPEAARGARAVETPADVFAFGIVAYEMLSGRAPFSVPAFMLAMAEQSLPQPAPLDARAPPALRALVLECLAGDPTMRPRIRRVLAELAPVSKTTRPSTTR